MTYRILNVGDSAAKKVSKALSNPSAKKILDYLSEKKASESDLVKKLGMKESTVSYTIKLLMDSELITIYGSKYSTKGKDMKYYMVSDRPIVIVPKASLIAQLGMILPAVLCLLLFVGLMPFFGGLTQSVAMQETGDISVRSIPMAAEMKVEGSLADSDAMMMQTSNAVVESETAPEPVSNSSSNLWFMVYGALLALFIVILTLTVVYFYKR